MLVITIDDRHAIHTLLTVKVNDSVVDEVKGKSIRSVLGYIYKKTTKDSVKNAVKELASMEMFMKDSVLTTEILWQ